MKCRLLAINGNPVATVIGPVWLTTAPSKLSLNSYCAPFANGAVSALWSVVKGLPFIGDCPRRPAFRATFSRNRMVPVTRTLSMLRCDGPQLLFGRGDAYGKVREFILAVR